MFGPAVIMEFYFLQLITWYSDTARVRLDDDLYVLDPYFYEQYTRYYKLDTSNICYSDD